MEQRLNEARMEHAKAGECVIQDSVNRNGTKIKWGGGGGEHAKAGEFVMQDSINRNGTKIKWGQRGTY